MLNPVKYDFEHLVTATSVWVGISAAILVSRYSCGKGLEAFVGNTFVMWWTGVVSMKFPVHVRTLSLTYDQFAKLRPQRLDRVLLVLDLAVPRDFEASLDDFPNLYLYQIDDLQAACQRNRHEREKEWPKAQRIITDGNGARLTDG